MTARSVGIGIVGAGFLAETRARCYGKVGNGAGIVAVTSRRRERAEDYARRHGVPVVAADLDALLENPAVDVVDLCVPNLLHRPMTERAAAAGKHVVCTKPLAAYVGQDLAEDATDAEVSSRDRSAMAAVAVADAEAMDAACTRAGVQLMYGENWVYAPAIRRARELLQVSGAKVLEMRGHESHSGSHSEYSRLWRHTGGGALLRLGAHPIGAMLELKRPIRPIAVSAEVGDLTAELPDDVGVRVASGWVDVENWGCAILQFEDGSRGVAMGSDNVLGGMESNLEIMASSCRLKCRLSPVDLLAAYAPDTEVFGDAYIMEKVDSGAGWTTPIPDEDWSSGHLAMCADFVAAVAEERPALADGSLGVEVTRVVYAAYVAAAQGRRVPL